MKKNKPSHIHKLVRINVAVTKTKPKYVYTCKIEGCGSYFIPKLAEGRETLCYNCDEITTVRKNIAKPLCDDCSNPVSNKEILRVLEEIEE